MTAEIRVLAWTIALSLLVLAITKYSDKFKRAPQSELEPARVWSKVCQRQGKDVFAWQSDGGPWHVECVTRTAI